MIIGLMGAMPEEIEKYISLLSDCITTNIGGRIYHQGKINGHKTVVVFSRWGKVAAATTVSTLINHFHITELIFTGVAGAVDSTIKIGDVVIAKRLIQHDMDARPIMRQFEIPLLGIDYFTADESKIIYSKNIFENLISSKITIKNNGRTPKLIIGEIASGDKFFSTQVDKDKLISELPNISCVEMEGAAVAQVCYEYSIPFLVIRVISDEAGNQSEIDFAKFVKFVSIDYFAPFIKSYFSYLTKS